MEKYAVYVPRLVKKEENFAPGHRACIGCGEALAVRMAFKALGNKNLSWQDVEILNDADGKPSCVVLNNKGKNIAVHVSISHVKNYAVANAIIAEKS